MNPTKDWEGVIKKMRKVGTAIKQRKGSFKERVWMINTYLIPCMGYLARFKLISKAVSSKMWKTIRSALGAYANLKSCVMTSLCPPFFEKPQVKHPILFNWALLISRKPLQDHYRNPLSIGAMRIDALEASGAISEQVRMGSKTKRSFSLLSRNISVGVENFYVGDGCLKCVIYNLSLPQRPQIKWNLLKFFLRGLPTVDKIAHFTAVSPLCWLCRKAKESRVHLLEECLKAKAILKTIGRRCFVLKIPGWESADFVCGFTNQYLKKAEASAVSAALLSLWITVCAEGSKSPSFAVKIFDEIAKTNKMIPKQTVRKAPPKGKREVKQPKFKYPALQVFYDGSGRVDPHIGGAGYVIIKEGLEVGGGFETIPLGSNNLGEFSGCLAGLQQVIGFGQCVEMVGDCKILTEAAPKTKPIDNFELNEILSEIRNIAESKFAKVEYTHVYHKFNKRSDAIATAASHSEEDGMEAVFDRNWDPRSKQLATTSEEWIIENSKLWKWVMEPLDLDWSFPVKKAQFKRRFKDKVITTNNVYFPVQAALDGAMISPVFISDDIVKWFPERAAPGEMLESFVEKENENGERSMSKQETIG